MRTAQEFLPTALAMLISEAEDVATPISSTWPDPMPEEAFHGIAGEIVRAIEPNSEADPVATLLHVLVTFGNMVGHQPHFYVGGTKHFANLMVVNVGATASRKGTAKDDTFFVMRPTDPNYFDAHVKSGMSSGEGFIWAVRDPIVEMQPIKEKGRVVGYEEVVTDHGVEDKRLLLIEPEFGSTLRVMGRDHNTLSAQIRQAWDSGSLRVLTKNSPAKATDAHISILGHITPEELHKYLGETERANGFGNRILWAAVKRSKFLPDGGNLRLLDLSGVQDRLKAAVEFARSTGEVTRSAAARELWHKVYMHLVGDRKGLFGAVTSRAEAQTMRLAMIYALLDCSPVIEVHHLKAALAVWGYCEQSAQLIFGDKVGDRTADEILVALRGTSEGMTLTELHHRFSKNKSAEEIGRALAALRQRGLVYSTKEPVASGRPAERWFARERTTKETNLTKAGAW